MYINTNKFHLSGKIAQIRLGNFVITHRHPRASEDRRWFTISFPKRTISFCITHPFKSPHSFITTNSTIASKRTYFKFLFIGGWYRKEV